MHTTKRVRERHFQYYAPFSGNFRFSLDAFEKEKKLFERPTEGRRGGGWSNSALSRTGLSISQSTVHYAGLSDSG